MQGWYLRYPWLPCEQPTVASWLPPQVLESRHLLPWLNTFLDLNRMTLKTFDWFGIVRFDAQSWTTLIGFSLGCNDIMRKSGGVRLDLKSPSPLLCRVAVRLWTNSESDRRKVFLKFSLFSVSLLNHPSAIQTPLTRTNLQFSNLYFILSIFFKFICPSLRHNRKYVL